MTVQAASVDRLLDQWREAIETLTAIRALAERALAKDKSNELAGYVLLLTEPDPQPAR